MEASALALGRITVLSTLGEPLRAEIELAEINAAEAVSLQTKIASPNAFKAAGVEFSPALLGVSITLQQRVDGRSYLRLVGNRTVSEPFVDLLIEVNSSAGRISRDYTLLFDPPGLRSNAAVAQSAQTVPMVPRTNMPSAPQAVAPEAFAARVPAPFEPKSPEVSVAPKAASVGSRASGSKFVVRPGDTSGKIAARVKSNNVSLDQMLVALLQQNPDAFIDGNVNRVKSGAILQIPANETVARVTAAQAVQIIEAQSADFNAFRRNLANAVPTTATANAARQANGKLQAKVEDRAPASTVPDKLMLSKGAVSGQSAASAEQQIATARQVNESAARVAELSKNISDLNKIGVASSTAAGGQGLPASGVAVSAPATVAAKPPTTTASAAPIAAAGSSAPTTVSTTPAASLQAVQAIAATLPASAAIAAAPVSAAVGAASTASVITLTDNNTAALPLPTASAILLPTTSVASLSNVPAADTAKSSFTEELMDNPLILTGLALLVALLGGFAFYRRYQQKQSTQIDSSFLESRLQPDSFFGASGGQHIDTNDGSAAGSSLVYSPSQLDATGDVDPVAEADVYLAYGRDLQAEEILKEALETNPMRVAVHAKLLEIYAKRHDAKAFGVIATKAFKITRGEGTEWRYIMEMGRELDPSNNMYLPGGKHPAKSSDNQGSPYTAELPSSSDFGSSTLPQAIKPQLEESASAVDFNLDLDFSMDERVAKAPVVEKPGALITPALPTHAAHVTVPPVPVPMFDDFSMNFAGDKTMKTAAASVAQRPATDEPLSFDSIAFPDIARSEQLPTAAFTKPASFLASNAPLEFDLSELSLDMQNQITEMSPQSGHSGLEDPLETKLSLAQEFSSLGDLEGARALAEEVLLEAKGPLKIKAQAFLNALF